MLISSILPQKKSLTSISTSVHSAPFLSSIIRIFFSRVENSVVITQTVRILQRTGLTSWLDKRVFCLKTMIVLKAVIFIYYCSLLATGHIYFDLVNIIYIVY